MQELIRAITENHYRCRTAHFVQCGDDQRSNRRAILSNAGSSRRIFMSGKGSARRRSGGYRLFLEAPVERTGACAPCSMPRSGYRSISKPIRRRKRCATPLLPGDLTLPPIAAIFYDAIPHRFPKNYLTSPRMKSFYRRRLESHRCYAVNLCISNFSQAEALDLFPDVTAVNISAGLSADFLSAMGSGVGEYVQCPNSMYVLYVGGLDWRKNVALAGRRYCVVAGQLAKSGQAYSRRSSASILSGRIA